MPSVVLRLAKVCAHGKRADCWFERAGRVRREHTRLETAVAGCSTVGVERTRIVASVCELRYPVNGRSRAARALDRGHHLHNGPLSALDNLQLRIESRDNLSVVFLSLEC